MKPTLNILSILGLLSLSASMAVAQDGAPKGDGGGRLAEFLKRADKDTDGKISKAEFDEFSRKDNGDRFAKMDTNADGYVDETEMRQVAKKLRDAMKGRSGSPEGGFRRPGGEGGESGFRRPPGSPAEGDRPRPDGDRPRPEGDRPRPEGDRPEGGRPPGGPGGPGGPPGGFDLDEIYGRMDKNADGSVDKAEYTEFSKQEIEARFGRMDENQDGKVTKEEMKTSMERMRNMMRGPGGPGGPPGGMRRPGGEGGEGGFRRPGGEGEGGFRRPPSPEGGAGRPRPELEGEAPKKDPA